MIMIRGCAGSWKSFVVYALAVAAVLLAPAGARAQADPNGSVVAAIGGKGQDVELRRNLAEQVVAAREQASGRSFDALYRADLLDRLGQMSLDTLQAALRDQVIPLAPGDTSSDLIYTPVTPCRAFDTRFGGGGLMSAGSTRSLRVTGDSLNQGGVASCGVPFGPGAATAVAINLTAVGYGAPGDLRATPFGTAMPLASILNYAPGMGGAVANGIALKLCDPSVATCTSDLTLQADATAVHVVGDVVGYFRSFAPTAFKIAWSGAWMTLNEAGGYITVTQGVFNPKVTGTVLAHARGYCSFVPTGTPTTVQLAIGTSAPDAFGSIEDGFGLLTPPPTVLGGGTAITVSYSAERVLTLERGVNTGVYLFGKKTAGEAAVQCRGTLSVEALF